VPNPREYHFRLPRFSGAPLPEPPHAWYPGAHDCAPRCTSDRLLRGDGKVRAFVLHATAGGSCPGAMSVLLGARASWHWLIPGREEADHGRRVWACAPERRAAWHVRNDRSHPDVNGGQAGVNYWSLGLEIVNRQQGDPFSDWQVEQAAALVRYAWSKYPDLVDVVSHAKLDPERRSDPGSAFPWERFRALVLAPAPSAPGLREMAPRGIRVVGPDGTAIPCDPRTVDGVTVVEARPLVEALGYRVVYENGTERTLRIEGPARPARARSAKPKPKAKAKPRRARTRARR
jgi:N-acetylmuramoyl-L-alanine amidase